MKINPNARYSRYGLILHEDEISAEVVSGKAVLKA